MDTSIHSWLSMLQCATLLIIRLDYRYGWYGFN